MPTGTEPFGVRSDRSTVDGAKRPTLCMSRTTVSTFRRQTRSDCALPRCAYRGQTIAQCSPSVYMTEATCSAESDTVAPGACWVAMYQHVVQQRPSCLTKAEFAPPSIDGTSRRIRHHG